MNPNSSSYHAIYDISGVFFNMHGIIRQGNGKYYVSTVFGHYVDITAKDDYGIFLQEIHNRYWIVWDEKKERLIRWHNMTPNIEYLIPQILIIDADQSNWSIDDKGIGCVSFLSRELLDSFLDKEQQPEDILNMCRSIGSDYIFKEIQQIKTKKDIENLNWVSGGFHDAYIKREEMLNDETLYVRFDGVWGCEIEIWFTGEVEYDTSTKNPEFYDPYWFGSTILLQNGFVYLIDDEDMEDININQLNQGYTYFKARNMKYRVIPD